LSEKHTTPRRAKQDLPGRLSSDFKIYKLEKIFGGGEGKKKYHTRQCKVCAAHKEQTETRYICKLCIVLLHKGSCFEKYHSVMNYWNINMQFGAQERNVQCQTIRKNMLWGSTFKVFKISGNGGYLIKRSCSLQCVN